MPGVKRKRSFLSRHPRLKCAVYTVYGLLFVLGWLLTLPLRLLPKRVTYWLGRCVAVALVYPRLERKINLNLEYVYGSRMTPRRARALGLKSVINAVWSALDCYYLWIWWWQSDIRRIVERAFNREPLDRAIAQGRGVIVVTGHYHCFELMPVYVRKVVHSDGGVIPRSFPAPLLNWLYGRLRMMHNIPSFFDDVKGVVRALRAGGVVGILPDLHARKRLGVPALFYGKPTLTLDIHVRIASQLGCPIIPAFMMRHRRIPWQYSIVFYAPIAVPRKAGAEVIAGTTQTINDLIEWHLRRYPGGWIWFHNKWGLW